MRGWQRAAAVAVLTIAGIQGLDLAVKTAPLPGAASRFLHYYEALEQRGALGLWERLLYSWVLAGGRDSSGSRS